MLTESCNETDRFGYPCCISAHCVLTQQDSSGRLQFYPNNTQTFAIFSLYDIYLLAPGLATMANLEESTEEANSGNGMGGLGIVLNFLRIAGEYGGTMNNTLDVTTTQVSTLDERERERGNRGRRWRDECLHNYLHCLNVLQVSFLSYYVTQCFQHIYLAASTLWGDGEGSVFGSNSIEFTSGTTSFRYMCDILTVESPHKETAVIRTPVESRHCQGSQLDRVL